MNSHASRFTLATLMFAATAAFAQCTGSAGSQGQGAAANDASTPGWNSMSAEERSVHRRRMQSFRTYDECSRYMTQMRSRGGSAGATPSDPGNATGGPSGTGPSAGPAVGGNDPCGHLPRS